MRRRIPWHCHFKFYFGFLICSTYYKYDAEYKYKVLYVSIFLIRSSFPGIKQSNGTPPETIIVIR